VSLVAAFLFGVVAGLRAFTGEGVYFAPRGGIAGIAFPILALAEYVGDALPQTPPRTTIGPLLVRCASGAFMGWTAARVFGAIVGVAGALIGTFGGYRARMWLIANTAALPAAILEDVVAIGLAVAALFLGALL
jgi:uncharacterized membrane protein